jgi:hypothetical protein
VKGDIRLPACPEPGVWTNARGFQIVVNIQNVPTNLLNKQFSKQFEFFIWNTLTRTIWWSEYTSALISSDYVECVVYYNKMFALDTQDRFAEMHIYRGKGKSPEALNDYKPLTHPISQFYKIKFVWKFCLVNLTGPKDFQTRINQRADGRGGGGGSVTTRV